MSGLVIAIAAGWVATGLLLSIVMGRRGHDSFGWLVTGTYAHGVKSLCQPQ